ncbi:MAG TPA: 16S rRNA (guanine(966)-N(2))-methyltransferase RsmD [Treponemataceae bacterium]|jgi:16S rRNA (guanine966-N2)-methyltransferase|nr:16S rRNA (guanine(966)-N(2))-methyltransferase RsmD [Treponemataceae bacterium]HOS35238.1 16S rRNA (guanine(966)-N(2))-methyltransferase RsmD [Treponemataceae bacterium]HOU38243.1 16S rRNA (guanine(966)-N(2))-methyltransferase RsmD [Treponemataceae bacterium]HPL91033.1 16S rRNA (guanine(966)-N(2))-methyltransferase RsmD [Treponemataceae bacterium]HPX14575.1 16S rRNA (guanine(966)-N(2))-methyltransferase RsmD [Treponemataceae bacterium]
MRITGGTLTGRKIRCPGGTIRPAMDRMRESLFAILGDLAGKSFLDLFSGSGICALEASSRGADPVFLVEKDPIKVDVILSNVAMAPNRIECKFQPVELFMKRAKTSFDIIYMDPPFPYKFHRELIATAGSKPVLKNGGLAIIHRPRELELPEKIGIMTRTDQRVYGRSVVDFYTKDENCGN